MTDFPQIVVGTYEEFILGFQPQPIKLEGRKLKLHQTFVTHSHQASVRCIAAGDRFMASSGADEYINIYDMFYMKIFKVINYHDATVNSLVFTPDNTHLITANQKGDIAIFRCKDWNLVKLWKEAHKGANGVISMSIHPTGSLLLTTGSDNILRFWNLIKGRQAYATNYSKTSIGSSLNYGAWSSNGRYYIVCVGKQAEIYETKTAAVIYKIVMNFKITCATFCKKHLICIGNEEGNLEIHSLALKALLVQEKAHKARLKCMVSFNKVGIINEKNKVDTYLVTADSLGIIKLWNLRKKGPSCTLFHKAEVNCDCRITCISIVPKKDLKQGKLINVDENLNGKVCPKECEQIQNLSSESIETKSLNGNLISKEENQNSHVRPVSGQNTNDVQNIVLKNFSKKTTCKVSKKKRTLPKYSANKSKKVKV